MRLPPSAQECYLFNNYTNYIINVVKWTVNEYNKVLQFINHNEHN